MTLDEIVAEVTDEIRAKDPKTQAQLHDMICDELDNYPEVDDMPCFYIVSGLIKDNFNL